MDARTHRACVENQRNAATWYEKARDWRDVAAKHGSEIVQSAARDFALRDQDAAARMYRADRRLRLGDD